MKLYLLVLALLVAASGLPAFAHGEGTGIPPATLKKLFPQADNFTTKPVNLTAEQRQRLEARLGSKLSETELKAPAYVASRQGRSIGVVWSAEGQLKQGPVDVIVGLDLQGKLVGVALAHSPVASLGQSSYLKQYQRLTARSSFQEGKDLKALSGQPGSQVVAQAARKAAIVIHETFLGGK